MSPTADMSNQEGHGQNLQPQVQGPPLKREELSHFNVLKPTFLTIEPPGLERKRHLPKSRNGCITCRIRRKKCNEVRPICADCMRFGKDCVWVERHMTPDEIKALRERVEEQEIQTKMRKRRKIDLSKVPKDDAKSKTDRKSELNGKESKGEKREKTATKSSGGSRKPEISNTTGVPIGSAVSGIGNRLFPVIKESTQDSFSSEPLSEVVTPPFGSIGKVEPTIAHHNSEKHSGEESIGPSTDYIAALKQAYVSTASLPKMPDSKLDMDLIPHNGAQVELYGCTNTNYNKAPKYSPTLNRSETLAPFTVPISLPALRDQPDLPAVFGQDALSPPLNILSPPPLDVEYYKENEDLNPGSPAALLNFFKELSLFNAGALPSKIALIEESHEHIENTKQEQEVVGTTTHLPNLRLSPNFNILEFMEFVLNHGSPEQLSHLASSFNNAFGSSPQPSLSVLPGLDNSGNYLYNYYVDTLSRKVSIAPHSQDESNSYQKVFLPLAQKDKGVLYGILAWAGFHLGGSWLAEGSKYAEMAVNHLRQDVDFNNTSTLKHDRRTILNKLAALLILCGAEICRGDVKYWTIYLNWCWKLLRDNGGILNFDTNKEEHWLISNFAYHDLLASSTSQRGTYFPVKTYDRIFTDPDGVSKGNLNPLLGVCKNLFKVIGDISSLAYESKKSLDHYYNRASPVENSGSPSTHTFQSPENQAAYYLTDFEDINSDLSEHGRTGRLLLSIIERARNLEHSIDTAKPDSDDLMDLSDSELELQLTTFEAFQLSCKLYLRQSIMKCNPSSLESQVFVNDLVKCIDILIDSPMQATLVFPIFIAGIHMVTEDDRVVMKQRMQKMMDMYGPWNVVRVKYLLELVWERNPEGDRVVDWNSILVELGWDLNFA